MEFVVKYLEETKRIAERLDASAVARVVEALRAVRDREDELSELLEHQRSTRARVEGRLNAVEQQLADAERGTAAAAEERALLAQQLAGGALRVHELRTELLAQRDAYLEHVQRLLRADEDDGRQQAAELERRARTNRTLLTRLAETLEETTGEQPL